MNSLTYERRRFIKIVSVTALIFALVFMPFFFAAKRAYANAEAASEEFAPPEKEQTQTVYHFFDDPVSLCADDEYLYVLDGSEIKRFSLSEFEYSDYALSVDTAAAPTAFAVRGDTAITVENGVAVLYNSNGRAEMTDVFGSDCRNVYINETHIYAQTGDAEIVRYGRTDADKTTFSSDREIKNFTVLSGTIYFSCTNGSNKRNDDIRYFTAGNETASAVEKLPETVAMHSFGDLLATIDGKNVTLYSRGISELISESVAPLDTDAVAVAASENDLFVLSADKSIARYSARLKEKTLVLASASDELGFFDSPSDVITRKNKTYIVDRNNNRIVVHDGKNYSAISDDLFRPVAVAADHVGKIYVAYSESKIAVFDVSGNRLTDPQNEIIATVDGSGETQENKVAIADLKCDLKGTLYLLSRSGGIFVKTADENAFSPLKGLESGVNLIDVSPNSAYVFALASASDGKKTVKRISGNSVEDTGIILGNVKDVAADTDNSIYVLQVGDKISRYNRTASGYELGEEQVISDCGELSRITVSNVSNDAIEYRDLILTEAERHRIRTVSHTAFGIDIGDVSTPPAVDDVPRPVSSKPIIRTVINPAGAEIYAQSSEVTLLRTLPYGHKVIVPDYDAESAFSLVLADNVVLGSSDYSKDPIITGYVHNEFLSEPLPYSDIHEAECSAWISSVPVYKYPSRQAPKIADVAKGTSLTLLDFVSENTQNGSTYGYTDNFPNLEELLNNRRWYRVLVEKDGETCEGYVVASTVSVLAGNPDMSVRPQVNAEIIAKDKNVPTAGAIIYKRNDNGDYEADNRFEPLPVGTKVEVIGAFDSSEPYTKIAFFTENGTVTAFVETANLKYHGVNVVKIVAAVLIVLTVALIVFLCIRVYTVKRNKINKSVRYADDADY